SPGWSNCFHGTGHRRPSTLKRRDQRPSPYAYVVTDVMRHENPELRTKQWIIATAQAGTRNLSKSSGNPGYRF
ncbi:hypothetical protein E0H68_35495, partial [Rhizobium leguminosarum bv. viciae]